MSGHGTGGVRLRGRRLALLSVAMLLGVLAAVKLWAFNNPGRWTFWAYVVLAAAALVLSVRTPTATNADENA